MLALLLACTPAAIQFDGKNSGSRSATTDSGDSGEGLPGDTSDTADTADSADTGEKNDTSKIFNLDAVHRVDVTVSNADLQALASDYYTYVQGDVVVDGEEFPAVGVRVKGRLGSLRDIRSQKAAMKIDLLEYGGTKQLEGLEKFNLNNMVQDCAGISEIAAYEVNEKVEGVPSPHVGYAWVTVNGKDYGLYSMVEDYDDEFLQRAFDDPAGNLYDGDYHLWPDWSYTLVDYTTASQDYMQLDEGDDTALDQVHALTAAISATMGTKQFRSTVGPLVDLDEFARFWAAAAWTGHSDSYAYYSNNYREYIPPGQPGIFMPWDPDWAFYSSTAVTAPYGVLAQACKLDTECHEKFLTEIDGMSDGASAAGIPDDLEKAIALINPYFQDDPKLERDMGSIRQCQADIQRWFGSRSTDLGFVQGL